jgi:hypothetical protein
MTFFVLKLTFAQELFAALPWGMTSGDQLRKKYGPMPGARQTAAFQPSLREDENAEAPERVPTGRGFGLGQ